MRNRDKRVSYTLSLVYESTVMLIAFYSCNTYIDLTAEWSHIVRDFVKKRRFLKKAVTVKKTDVFYSNIIFIYEACNKLKTFTLSL